MNFIFSAMGSHQRVQEEGPHDLIHTLKLSSGGVRKKNMVREIVETLVYVTNNGMVGRKIHGLSYILEKNDKI